MRTHVVLHAIALVCLGLGLVAANCEGTGLTQDCEPGELGCACGSFPECPDDEHNRPTLCCPDPLLYCGDGNICMSIGSSGGPTDTGDDGDDGSGSSGSSSATSGTTTPATGSSATGTTTATSTTTPTATGTTTATSTPTPTATGTTSTGS